MAAETGSFISPDIVRLSDLTVVPLSLRGGVVAIGNFDGVHRGHQAVLERALEEAGIPRDRFPALKPGQFFEL